MKIEGRKIILNKPSTEIIDLLKDTKNYENLMPSGLEKFEAKEDGFSFELKGLPKISLKLGEATHNSVSLVSAISSIDFTLTVLLEAIEQNKTEAQIVFDGNINPFMKMMIEKPIKNFIASLSDKAEQYYS